MTPKLYKAAEVCEKTQLQPYVLRSWEKEFPGIGVQKTADGPRFYRDADVEQVQRIKQLVFGEGLTLAGARRRLEGAPAIATPTPVPDADDIFEALNDDARAKINVVRESLRSLLADLSREPATVEGRGTPGESEEYELSAPARVAARPVANRGMATRTAATTRTKKAVVKGKRVGA